MFGSRYTSRLNSGINARPNDYITPAFRELTGRMNQLRQMQMADEQQKIGEFKKIVDRSYQDVWGKDREGYLEMRDKTLGDIAQRFKAKEGRIGISDYPVIEEQIRGIENYAAKHQASRKLLQDYMTKAAMADPDDLDIPETTRRLTEIGNMPLEDRYQALNDPSNFWVNKFDYQKHTDDLVKGIREVPVDPGENMITKDTPEGQITFYPSGQTRSKSDVFQAAGQDYDNTPELRRYFPNKGKYQEYAWKRTPNKMKYSKLPSGGNGKKEDPIKFDGKPFVKNMKDLRRDAVVWDLSDEDKSRKIDLSVDYFYDSKGNKIEGELAGTNFKVNGIIETVDLDTEGEEYGVELGEQLPMGNKDLPGAEKRSERYDASKNQIRGPYKLPKDKSKRKKYWRVVVPKEKEKVVLSFLDGEKKVPTGSKSSLEAKTIYVPVDRLNLNYDMNSFNSEGYEESWGTLYD